MNNRTTFFTALLLIAIIFVRCNKEDITPYPYLSSLSIESSNSDELFKYEYDSENRLVKINSSSGEELYSYQNETISYSAFDNEGNFTDLKEYFFSNNMLDSSIHTGPYLPLYAKRLYEYNDKQYIKQEHTFYDGPDEFFAIYKYTFDNHNLTIIDATWGDTSYSSRYLEYDSYGNMTKVRSDDINLVKYEYTEIINPLHRTSEYFITNRPFDFHFHSGPKRMFHYSKYLISKEIFYYETELSHEYSYEYQLDEFGKPLTGTITLGDLIKNIEFKYK